MGGGGGNWGREEIVQNAIFHGKRHDNKLLNVKFLLSRSFVVMAQAPTQIHYGAGKNGTDLCSEMLVFLGKGGRETVQIVKNYGGSKILRIRAPSSVVFLVRKGPLGKGSLMLPGVVFAKGCGFLLVPLREGFGVGFRGVVGGGFPVENEGKGKGGGQAK